ncbi:MAG: hypothetical protein H0T62_06250 [Parachlamydiaceae bacterium]|nr:hypothetical protein [Parachlamydiaceae bacterium]
MEIHHNIYPNQLIPNSSTNTFIKDTKTDRTAVDILKTIGENQLVSKNDYIIMRAEIRQLKSEIKTEQKNLNTPTKLFRSVFDSTIKKREVNLSNKVAQYNSIRTEYRLLESNHSSLQEAKKISKFMKKNSENSKLENAFKNEFENIKTKYGLLGDFSAILGSDDPRQKDNFLGALVEGLESVRLSETLQKREITWLHGTRSPAMGIMLAMDKTLRLQAC